MPGKVYRLIVHSKTPKTKYMTIAEIMRDLAEKKYKSKIEIQDENRRRLVFGSRYDAFIFCKRHEEEIDGRPNREEISARFRQYGLKLVVNQ